MKHRPQRQNIEQKNGKTECSNLPIFFQNKVSVGTGGIERTEREERTEDRKGTERTEGTKGIERREGTREQRY